MSSHPFGEEYLPGNHFYAPAFFKRFFAFFSFLLSAAFFLISWPVLSIFLDIRLSLPNPNKSELKILKSKCQIKSKIQSNYSATKAPRQTKGLAGCLESFGNLGGKYYVIARSVSDVAIYAEKDEIASLATTRSSLSFYPGVFVATPE